MYSLNNQPEGTSAKKPFVDTLRVCPFRLYKKCVDMRKWVVFFGGFLHDAL